MQGLEEVLIVLVFIGIMLVQFITKQRARRQPKPPVPTVPPEMPMPTVPPDMRAPTRESRAGLAGLDQPIPKVWPPRARADAPAREPAPAVAIARPPAPRRFSRASLFADRRAVQDAIAIATILGPCRALEPPGSEASAAAPPRAAR